MLCPQAVKTSGGMCRVWRNQRVQISDQGTRTACVPVADVQLLVAVEDSQPGLGSHLHLEHARRVAEGRQRAGADLGSRDKDCMRACR